MNWPIPPYESQNSVLTHTDAEDCVSESLCHCIYMLTGRRYSPRALAYLSHTTHFGNRVDVVLATANNNGLIPYDLWPTPDSFTWETYYTPIPPEVLAKGENLGIELIAPDLNKSPLWTEIEWGNPVYAAHMVAQINDTEYFDSELGNPIKPIGDASIVYQTSIKLKGQTMPQIKSLNLKGEEGIFLAAATPEEYQALCLIFGKDPLKPDETV